MDRNSIYELTRRISVVQPTRPPSEKRLYNKLKHLDKQLTHAISKIIVRYENVDK